MNELCDFGLIGLAVMGENLALNIESRGYRIAVFNRTVEKGDAFVEGRAAGKAVAGCRSVEELVKTTVSGSSSLISRKHFRMSFLGKSVR